MREMNKYIDSIFYTEDQVLEEVLSSIKENGMRSMSISRSTGKLLSMLVSIAGAEDVLEIGALGGYSGICLAKGLGKDGKLTSLELVDNYAQLAHSNLTKAGFGDQVSYMVGSALESLKQLIAEEKRFDFFFIDADKENYENYLNYCMKLANKGALIVCDNVLANGSVAYNHVEPKHYTEFMKEFNKTVAKHPQLESTLIPIGDGLTVSRVIK